MLTRKPHKGERIRWPHDPLRLHTVTRTPEGDDNLCWILEDGKREAMPFIWRFRDGLNKLAEIVEGT